MKNQLSDSNQQKIDEISQHIEAIIRLVGEDPTREGLLKTPQRSAKALYYLTSGYRVNPGEMIEQALFDHEG